MTLEELLSKKSFISYQDLDEIDVSEYESEEFRDLFLQIERKNKKFYESKLKELKEYKEKQKNKEDPQKITKEEENRKNYFLEEEDETVDISFYWNHLKHNKNGNWENTLPKKENPQFFLLMNLLIAEVLKEIKEMEEFILKEQLEGEDKLDFEQEIIENRQLIHSLISYRDKKEESNVKETSKNKIVYLTSYNNNCYAISDASRDIEPDFYPSFLELIESIENGTFKNIKAFTNSEKLNGLLEVRNPQVRVIFKQIGENTYAILHLFVKKTNNNTGYRKKLEIRAENFRNQMDYMKRNLENESYLETQENYHKELKRILKREEER